MKIRLIFFCLLMPFLASAAKHLEFKGIPITGTISNFTSKLNAQGYTTNWEISEEIGGGETRWFDGKYYGTDCEVLVFYAPISKIVNGVNVIIERTSERSALNLMTDIKDALASKYNLDFEQSYEDGYPKWRVTVYDSNRYDATAIGSIYISLAQNSSSGLYDIHVGFLDYENYEKYQAELQDNI